MSVLDELYEYVHELGELEEQLGEFVEDCLGLGESVPVSYTHLRAHET